MRASDDPDPLRDDVLRVDVHLPPPDKLIIVEPSRLLKIRQAYGAVYSEAVQEWSQKPSESGRDRAAKALDDYAKQLCREYPARTLFSLWLKDRGHESAEDKMRSAADWMPDVSSDHFSFPM